MKSLKIISGYLLAVVMILSLVGGVFALDEPVNVYNVEYKEFNLYKSVVTYEKDYSVEIEKPELVNAFINVSKIEFSYIINDSEIKNPYRNRPEKLKILVNNRGSKKEFLVNLKTGENVVEIAQNVGNVTFYKYKIVINVLEKDSTRINNEFNWIKSDGKVKPGILKFGEIKNKKLINLKDIIEYETSKDVYAIGKYIKYTENKKLTIGDNFLETKPIEGPKMKGIKYWIKAEFIVSLTEKQEGSPIVSSETSPSITPNTSINPESSIVTNGNIDNKELPKTGEENPILKVFIGMALIFWGVFGILAYKIKKSKATN